MAKAKKSNAKEETSKMLGKGASKAKRSSVHGTKSVRASARTKQNKLRQKEALKRWIQKRQAPEVQARMWESFQALNKDGITVSTRFVRRSLPKEA